MKRQIGLSAFVLAVLGSMAWVPIVWAVDIEAFEFGDAAGTPLANAANTGTGDIGTWVEDPEMAPSDIRGGVYNVVKGSSALDSNYFQINNITSGTYYLVTRLANWRFGDSFDPANAEEFRVGFLNDDDADFGSTITAQMGIRRTGVNGAELFGDALGTGSSNIANPAPLATVQSQPFTAVIELNKTSNTYKVFYKDGTNSTQVLGMGAVAPTRDGNSVRMVANNDWSEFNLDYPVEPPYEVMAVDRIALSDTNPFNDLITLEIDRDNAAMTLRNTSGATISGIQSYSIKSATGALNPAGWSPGGATPTVSTNDELAATFTTPINMTNGQSLPLSTGVGAWVKSPFEDFQMVLNLTGGATRTVNVNFIDNGGVKYPNGDFDFNNTITGSDWLSFIADAETDIDSLSRALRYQAGDLNGDGFNNIADFVEFEALYDAFNGLGSFDAMIAGLSVPEPGSAVLLGTAAMFLTARRRRRGSMARPAVKHQHDKASDDPAPAGDIKMSLVLKLCPCVIVAAAMTAAISPARAVILEDFPFSDSNGTTLDAAANTINIANTWQLGGESWDPSVVNNGAYRITKTSTNLATAHIDMANVTTGKVWLVAEIAGWNYTATASSPSEQVRFAFLDNDNAPPSGSTITAQMDIRRSGGGLALVGIGALGTGATNITGQYSLPLVQTNPFTMVLELDKDADQYSVYYKDGGGSFAAIGAPGLLGASTLNPGDRDGNSIRFASTGAFNDVGEFFDVSRIYLTDTSPIGEVEPSALTLEVKSNGEVAIRNDTDAAISFNSYRITFGDDLTEDLNFAGWNSLSDQGIDAVGGGNDPGETWDEAGGSNDHVLAESFLLGSSTIGASPGGTPLSLGSAFRPGGDHADLVFEYHDVNLGAIIPGEIDFVVVAGVNGDYNNDGTVDAADYVVWRKNVGTTTPLPNDPTGGTIGTAQYNTWRANFGDSAGSGSGAAAGAVPEPASWWLAGLAMLLATAGHRWSPHQRAARLLPVPCRPRSR